MKLARLNELNLQHKRVLMRQDFNVPLSQGRITSEARILAALPSIQYALDQSASVILLSHLGRPPEGIDSPEYSLAPVASCLERHLKRPVRFIRDWLNGIHLQANEVVLCENVRMQIGEQANDPVLARKMAALCDVFVMDAFAVAHRTAASTVGIIRYAAQVCAGLLLQAELDHLSKALENPKRPRVALVGGAKVSTKLQLLSSLITHVDKLLLGGGIANTFLAAQNQAIGNSLYEPALLAEAARLCSLAHTQACEIVLPEDVIVAPAMTDNPAARRMLSDIQASDQIFDIGPLAAQRYAQHLKTAGTILWNGPVGVFEQPAFQQGTATIASAMADNTGFSIAGGGDTLAAIEHYAIADKISYISTGGGAFLAFLEGKPLAAVQALLDRAL